MKPTLEGSQSLTTKSIEQLRVILQRQQKRVITTDEAVEIGEALVDFYELLGSGDNNESQ